MSADPSGVGRVVAGLHAAMEANDAALANRLAARLSLLIPDGDHPRYDDAYDAMNVWSSWSPSDSDEIPS